MKPEEQARLRIDDQLTQAGWLVQDRKRLNLGEGYGVAVREFSTSAGPADYLLFVNREAVGVIEAKKIGHALIGVEEQSEKYRTGLSDEYPKARDPLPFTYETNSIELRFTNHLDPKPKSRRIFSFHRPQMLAKLLAQAPEGIAEEQSNNLRARLRHLPALNDTKLRDCQIEAITNLEQSFAENRPRALIQMATGSGKTYTAISSIYRLIKHGGAKRVLFLVDRSNLGQQTLKEFTQYQAPDDGRKFTELYPVQHLQSNTIDPVANVCITTIQRLYSILCGESTLDPAVEESSLFETDDESQPIREIQYNPAIPIETFDIIFVDECHRSIYNKWRGVLEYFDSFIVGLTATPNKNTFGFFEGNLVMEYNHARAVTDGVNVDYSVYRIRTQITEQGSKIEALSFVGKRDRLTRAQRWEQIDEDITYSASRLDRDVVAPDQIRTVIQTYRDAWKQMFPDHTDIPKTLIFAKDDSHAEQIVEIVRNEFGEGNEFAQKITYKTTGAKPEELISAFRNKYYPRIAVTVDMISTGTDIKPLEVLLFMRTVKSRGLFEQMKGRGSRVINDDDFQAITRSASGKNRFVIVDAVGVCEEIKTDDPPLERKVSVPLKKILDQVSVGKWRKDQDLIPTLVSRLSRLARHSSTEDNRKIQALCGKTIKELAGGLTSALSPDLQLAVAQHETNQTYLTVNDPIVLDIAKKIIQEAVAPFDNPDLREALLKTQQRDEIIIDETSQDILISSDWDIQAEEKARATVTTFKHFIEQNRNEITALQIFYERPRHVRLTFKDIKELNQAIAAPPFGLTTDKVWQAYAKIDPNRVHGTKSATRMLTDIVALIRYTIERDTNQDAVLEPYQEQVSRRFKQWLQEQVTRRGQPFSTEQIQLLGLICEIIATSVTIEIEDFEDPLFSEYGGLGKAQELFGDELPMILQDLNERLAA